MTSRTLDDSLGADQHPWLETNLDGITQRPKCPLGFKDQRLVLDLVIVDEAEMGKRVLARERP